jgi:hypothetical protein
MEHNVAAPEDIIPTDDKTPTEETVDMEQNVAAPEDIIPTDDKTPTAETGDAVGGEEKSIQVNTGDAVRGKEISVNEEDNTASRLRSGKHLFWICSTLMLSPTQSYCYIMYPKFAFISHFVSFHKLFPFLIW